MNRWGLLAGAILAEVAGTMALRASVDHAGWAPAVVVGYAAAYTLLGLCLRSGLTIGVAYGVWGACGVALTAVLGTVLFGEVLSGVAILGLGLIIVGVVLVETGARHTKRAATPEVTS